jgi:DNA-binding NarL/FixJ family response regulator
MTRSNECRLTYSAPRSPSQRRVAATWSRCSSTRRRRCSLTPSAGAQVARLPCEGLANPEIGTRLFISARTVQHHLSKVFTEMNLTSRNQLSRALDGGPSESSS